jgi:hypothetical protein
MLQGTSSPIALTMPFSVTTAAGMLAARRVSHPLSPPHVQIGFATALICVAVGLIAKSALHA